MADTISYKARVTYTAGEFSYTFPFLYLKKQFVKAYYTDTKGNTTDLVYAKDYSIEEQKMILAHAGNTTDTITIYRQTPTDQIVKYIDASILKAYDLNINQIQVLHILEEMSDTFNTAGSNWMQRQDTNGYKWLENIDADGAKWIKQQDTNGKDWVDKINATGTENDDTIKEIADYYVQYLQKLKFDATKALGFDTDDYYTKPEIDTMEVSDIDILALFDGRPPVEIPTDTNYDLTFATDADIINLFRVPV